MNATALRRDSGIPAVGPLGWGAHFCQFYRDKRDLVETLVPYFAAGLHGGESCLWITSEPLEAEEAEALMVDAVPEFRDRLASGQIEIRDLKDWYTPGSRFDADAVLGAWVDRERRACADGYAGLRLTGNTFWLERAGWCDFMAYEAKVNGTFGRHRILGLCTYSLDRCDAQDVLDVVRNHQFALSRRGGDWEVLESAAVKVAKDELLRANESLEERVRERTARLEQMLRSRDEFLAMLAHELRNPLAPVATALALLELSERLDAEEREVVGIADRQVKKLARLIDDLTDVSRVTRGKIRLDRGRVDLRDVLQGAAAAAQSALASRGHVFEIDLPPEPLPVLGDRTRLEQVFDNLLGNAAKYTPDGGRVSLSAGREGAEAVVRVRDTGVGIGPELLPHIFDLFTQADRSLDRSQGGLGIGLTVARGVTELHGGTVEAASAGPGLGSEFTVRLPLAPEPAPEVCLRGRSLA